MREHQRLKNPHIILLQTKMVETSNSSVTEDSFSAVKKCSYGASIQIFAAHLYYLFALVSFPISRYFFEIQTNSLNMVDVGHKACAGFVEVCPWKKAMSCCPSPCCPGETVQRRFSWGHQPGVMIPQKMPEYPASVSPKLDFAAVAIVLHCCVLRGA